MFHATLHRVERWRSCFLKLGFHIAFFWRLDSARNGSWSFHAGKGEERLPREPFPERQSVYKEPDGESQTIKAENGTSLGDL
jgi:hypothetical protein